MSLIRAGIEVGGGISPGCLENWRATDNAGKSRISPLSEGPRLESNGNAVSPRLDPSVRVRRYLFTKRRLRRGTICVDLRVANLESGIVMSW
jgi:hypothetical protein